MNQQNNIPRWQYRFINYSQAFNLLREAMEMTTPLSPLEKEGCIQRFEYAFELAWKTMKDYLEFEGVIITPLTPANVIRAAFAAKLISDGQLWLTALDARNKMAHTYDAAVFEQTLQDIRTQYLGVMAALHTFFANQAKGVYAR